MITSIIQTPNLGLRGRDLPKAMELLSSRVKSKSGRGSGHCKPRWRIGSWSLRGRQRDRLRIPWDYCSQSFAPILCFLLWDRQQPNFQRPFQGEVKILISWDFSSLLFFSEWPQSNQLTFVYFKFFIFQIRDGVDYGCENIWKALKPSPNLK